MHRALLFTCLSLAFVVTGCSDEYYLERQEDKIIGTWEFEKVFYQADNSLFRDNISGEYVNDIIEFYDDYTAIYDDSSLGKVYPGDWLIRLDKDYTEDGGTREFFVDIMFYGIAQGEDFGIFGEIDRLNQNKLHLQAYDRHGTYTFKLRKL